MNRLKEFLQWHVDHPHNIDFKEIVGFEDRAETLIAMQDMLRGMGKRSTEKTDISGQEILEGDIIECHQGTQILYGNLVIRYGTFQAFCPVDDCFMDSVGFYASGENLPDMPIGPTEDYAKVIGNVRDNPELVPWFSEGEVSV